VRAARCRLADLGGVLAVLSVVAIVAVLAARAAYFPGVVVTATVAGAAAPPPRQGRHDEKTFAGPPAAVTAAIAVWPSLVRSPSLNSPFATEATRLIVSSTRSLSSIILRVAIVFAGMRSSAVPTMPSAPAC